MLDAYTTTHARTPAVLWGLLTTGLLMLASATGLLLEDAIRSGHLSTQHWLQPVLAIGAATTAYYAHQGLREFRLGSGLGLALVALLGSCLIVYGTMGRQADARESRQAEARASNDVHAETKAELAKAQSERDRECRGGFGPKCREWQGRVDTLTKQLGGLKTAALDPRAEAIGDLAALVSFDRRRTMAIVAAVDPIALPAWLELGSIICIGAAFPRPRRRREKCEESETLSGKCEESVSLSLASEPLSYTKHEALEDFRAMRSVPSQKVLADRWARSEATVSKWLAEWESDGLVSRGVRFGKERAALALPAPGRS
jgi:hypothetical protein